MDKKTVTVIENSVAESNKDKAKKRMSGQLT